MYMDYFSDKRDISTSDRQSADLSTVVWVWCMLITLIQGQLSLASLRGRLIEYQLRLG